MFIGPSKKINSEKYEGMDTFFPNLKPSYMI